MKRIKCYSARKTHIPPGSIREARNPQLIGKPMFRLDAHISPKDKPRMVITAMRSIFNRSVTLRNRLKGVYDADTLFCFLSDNGPEGAYFGLMYDKDNTQWYGWIPDGVEQGTLPQTE